VRFKRLDHVKLNFVADECLALDGISGSCHILNEVAGWLLSICGDYTTLNDAVAQAEQRYAISPGIDAREEMRAALAQLHERGMIEVC
jgi:hypothetical protein